MTLSEQIDQMYRHELSLNGRATAQYALLRVLQRKEIPVGTFPSYAFFNPGRIASVMADISPDTIAHRQCFLCPEGLEDKQQSMDWQNTLFTLNNSTDKDGQYIIRVNPFPIFYHHYTISYHLHERQQIRGHYADMLALAKDLSQDYVIFYNGPKCGASAPDHMHFQAIPQHRLPMQKIVDENQSSHFDVVRRKGDLVIKRIRMYCKGCYVIKSESPEDMKEAFYETIACAKIREGEYEPRMNIVTWHDGNIYKTIVYFRNESRPSCFFSDDPNDKILISPGAVEMSGVAIVSNQDSYYKLNSDKLAEVMDEVSKDVKIY